MITHKNVCRMFDLGETEGAHFITMEYIRGEDDQWLCYLKVDPLLDPARQDPRYKELLQKMNLEDNHNLRKK